MMRSTPMTWSMAATSAAETGKADRFCFGCEMRYSAVPGTGSPAKLLPPPFPASASTELSISEMSTFGAVSAAVAI